MRKALIALVLALAALIPPLPAEGQAAKRALLIGINEYSGPYFPPLSGSLNDVQLLKEVLTSPKMGFPPENITVLLDGTATHVNIVQALTDLAAAAGREDLVYIHYSGHGSTACDLNGSAAPALLDSTLVTYGSRSGPDTSTAAGCLQEPTAAPPAAAWEGDRNDFDILSDKLEHILAQLSAAAGLVVFVADSCHSGSITRGEGALATRGVDMDARVNPDAFMIPRPPGSPRGWIGIGSAELAEKAKEFHAEDGRIYGAFTWYWARALDGSSSRDTWRTVFDRTVALMSQANIPHQRPLLEGNADRLINDGRESAGDATFTVMASFDNGRKAAVNVGLLAGVTEGSVFLAGDPQKPAARLVVAASSATKSEAVVEEGQVAVGDGLVLASWLPPKFALKAFLRAENPADEKELAKLRRTLGPMTAIEETAEPGRADMVLWIIRPRRTADGGYAETRGGLLPPNDPRATMEVWVLDPSETSFFAGQERLRASLTDEGLADLAENLKRIVKMRAILNMPAPTAGGGSPVNLFYRFHVPCPDEEWEALPRERRYEAVGFGRWKFSREVEAGDQTFSPAPGEDLILVKAVNQGQKPYYVYALNITENGQILSFLPSAHHPISTELPPKASHIYSDSALLMTDPVEYVRLMVSDSPFNAGLLNQPELMRTRSGRAGTSPLNGGEFWEDMLGERLTLTRGAAPVSATTPAAWGTVLTTFTRGEGN